MRNDESNYYHSRVHENFEDYKKDALVCSEYSTLASFGLHVAGVENYLTSGFVTFDKDDIAGYHGFVVIKSSGSIVEATSEGNDAYMQNASALQADSNRTYDANAIKDGRVLVVTTDSGLTSCYSTGVFKNSRDDDYDTVVQSTTEAHAKALKAVDAQIAAQSWDKLKPETAITYQKFEEEGLKFSAFKPEVAPALRSRSLNELTIALSSATGKPDKFQVVKDEPFPVSKADYEAVTMKMAECKKNGVISLADQTDVINLLKKAAIQTPEKQREAESDKVALSADNIKELAKTVADYRSNPHNSYRDIFFQSSLNHFLAANNLAVSKVAFSENGQNYEHACQIITDCIAKREFATADILNIAKSSNLDLSESNFTKTQIASVDNAHDNTPPLLTAALEGPSPIQLPQASPANALQPSELGPSPMPAAPARVEPVSDNQIPANPVTHTTATAPAPVVVNSAIVEPAIKTVNPASEEPKKPLTYDPATVTGYLRQLTNNDKDARGKMVRDDSPALQSLAKIFDIDLKINANAQKAFLTTKATSELIDKFDKLSKAGISDQNHKELAELLQTAATHLTEGKDVGVKAKDLNYKITDIEANLSRG